MILDPILSNLILALFLVVDVANSLLLSVYIELVAFHKTPFTYTPQPRNINKKSHRQNELVGFYID